MIHKLTWLIILVLGIFNLALADTVGPIRSMPPNPVGHNYYLNSAVLSPDDRYILSGSRDIMKLWQVDSIAEIQAFKSSGPSKWSVVFSPDGRYALSDSSTLSDNSNYTMNLWEVSSGAEIRTFKKSFNGAIASVTSVAFSLDGSYALSGHANNQITLWEVSNGDEIRTFKGHSDTVSSLAFSRDGRYILSGSRDNTIKLWDVSGGAEIRTFKGHSHYVTSVAFSPDGRYALSSSIDRTMKLWNLSSGAEIRTFEGCCWVWSVAFSPDGHYALSNSSNDMKLWDLSSGAEIRTFEGHSSSVYSVAFSLDGRYALSGSNDKTMKLWEVSSGAAIRTFKGHSESVGQVAFSPDGLYVFSAGYDRTLKVWKSGLYVNQLPQATFTINPNTGFAPLTVQLDASTSTDDGNIVQYKWTSSDGQTANGVQTSLTFSQVGTYNITLTVTDNEGATASSSQSVTVRKKNQPPQAAFSINPNTGFAPLTVQLDASTSTDDGNIVQYQWTSSDGQSAEGIQTSLTFSQAGTYNITLTVTDNEGATASSSQSVTVNEKPIDPPITESDQAQIEFEGLKSFYKVGDILSVDLVQKVQTNRFQRVDLWVMIEMPNGQLIYRTPLALVPFSIEPQAFKKSLENSNRRQRILDLEIPPGLGGTYVFYAVYVKEGSNPNKDGITVQRSNMARKKTTLADQ